MPNYNRVILMGNMTRDPTVRFIPSGTAVCDFGLAINETWFDKATNQKKTNVTFVDCTVWGARGEAVGQYFHKGSPIHIEGKLKLETWQDKETGQNRSKLKVVVDQFSFIERAQQAGQQGGGQQEQSYGGSGTSNDQGYGPQGSEPQGTPYQGTTDPLGPNNTYTHDPADDVPF